jgi:hypothetical protein
VPAYRAAKVTAGAVSWDYMTVVNIVFLPLAAALLVLLFCSGGAPVLKVMVGSPDVHEHARGVVAAALPRGLAPAGGLAGRRPVSGSALGVDAVPGGRLHRPVAGGAAEDHLAQ